DQSEVDPNRVDVEDVAQYAPADGVMDVLNRWGVAVGVIDHQRETGFVGGQHHCGGLRRRLSDRLLNHDVLSGGEGGQGELRVRLRRSGDSNGIDVLTGDQPFDRCLDVNCGPRSDDLAGTTLVEVAHRDEVPLW